jgi:FkbM family methyltransferase
MTLAFDIGSNSGNFTHYFLKESHFDKVISVEPNPVLSKFLSERFGHQNIEVVNKAVSDVSGKIIDFWVCNADGISTADEFWHTKGRFTHDKKNKWEKIQVETVTIDDLVKQYGAPNHIKVDVEGYESVVLKGMTVPYCPIRFEWTEEKINELEQSLYRLQSIGYSYFGVVVEDNDNFDQRPEGYFDHPKELVDMLKNAIVKCHDSNKFLPTESVSGYPGFEWNDNNHLLYWGMCWCFRKIDGNFYKKI